MNSLFNKLYLHLIYLEENLEDDLEDNLELKIQQIEDGVIHVELDDQHLATIDKIIQTTPLTIRCTLLYKLFIVSKKFVLNSQDLHFTRIQRHLKISIDQTTNQQIKIFIFKNSSNKFNLKTYLSSFNEKKSLKQLNWKEIQKEELQYMLKEFLQVKEINLMPKATKELPAKEANIYIQTLEHCIISITPDKMKIEPQKIETVFEILDKYFQNHWVKQ